MDINRSNYEIWLIDYLEGRLSKDDAEQVVHFLRHNPDLIEEFDCFSSLSPSDFTLSDKQKNSLLKSPSELPESQFEYLCAAFLENDLSSDAREEITEILNNDQESKRTFDRFLRTKLNPPPWRFRGKNRLYKRSPFQRIVILSVAGFSTIAAVILVIIALMVPRQQGSDKNISGNMITANMDSLRQPFIYLEPGFAIRAQSHSAGTRAKSVSTKKLTEEIPALAVETPPDETIKATADSSMNKSLQPEKIRFMADPGLKNIPSVSLIAYRDNYPVEDEGYEMSGFEKFITRTFREKFLKKKVPVETPLRGYEIAEASVAGLNKLFGWEMAINEKTDKNGELSSIQFSSKILNFKTPVRKIASAQ